MYFMLFSRWWVRFVCCSLPRFRSAATLSTFISTIILPSDENISIYLNASFSSFGLSFANLFSAVCDCSVAERRQSTAIISVFLCKCSNKISNKITNPHPRELYSGRPVLISYFRAEEGWTFHLQHHHKKWRGLERIFLIVWITMWTIADD